MSRRILYLSISILLLFSSVAFADEDYDICNVINIKVPSELELRKEEDPYTQSNENIINSLNYYNAVFQQSGLSSMSSKAYSHYVRLLVQIAIDEECEFPTSNDSDFSKDDIDFLIEECINELTDSMDFIKDPVAKVEKAYGNVYRVKISYVREGLNNKGNVVVNIYYLFNYKYAAKFVASYREKESYLWKDVLDKAVNSIRWNEEFSYGSVNDSNLVITSEENESEYNSSSIQEIIFLLFLILCVLLCVVFIIINNKYIRSKRGGEKENLNGKIDIPKQSETLTKKTTETTVIQKTGVSVNEDSATKQNIPEKDIKVGESLDKVYESTLPSEIKESSTFKKQIDDKYEETVFDEHRIQYVEYHNPQIKNKEDFYCFTIFPEYRNIVFPYRLCRNELRGYSELYFENELKKGLLDLSNYKILNKVSLLPVDRTHPYEPDIAIVENINTYGIRIDIEIDEPYSGYERRPIHYINCGDDYRDQNMVALGWIVIRFSEKQVYCETKQCIGYIRYILSTIDKNILTCSELIAPNPDKRWTYNEALMMAVRNYREKYLNHSFNIKDVEHSVNKILYFSNQTEFEKELSKLVETVPLPNNSIVNIDHSSLVFDKDNRIAFEPNEHIYILDGKKQLESVSNIVASYFPEFDTIRLSERVALRENRNQLEIIEEWDAKGLESREIGTFLHNQIENYFKNKDIKYTYRFIYKGEYHKITKDVSIEKEFSYFLKFIQENKITPFRCEWHIFDEKINIAGTIDLLCRNGSKFDLYDWKRSKKASPMETVWHYGINGLENVPDISFYRYALQQNLYKYILQKNYNIQVNKMYIVVLHDINNHYIAYEIPNMENEIAIILKSI